MRIRTPAYAASALVVLAGSLWAAGRPVEYNLGLAQGKRLSEEGSFDVERRGNSLSFATPRRTTELQIGPGQEVTILRRRDYAAVAVEGSIALLEFLPAVTDASCVRYGGEIEWVKDFYFAEDFAKLSDKFEYSGHWRREAPMDDLVRRDHGPDGPPMYSQLTVEGSGLSTAVTGYPSWDNYRVAATVVPGKSRYAGVIFNYRDAENYAALGLARDREGCVLSVVQVRNGRETVGDMIHLPQKSLDQWYRLGVQTVPGGAILFVNDRGIGATLLGNAPAFGRVGLIARDADGCFFDDFEVRRLVAYHSERSWPGTQGQSWALGLPAPAWQAAGQTLEPAFSLRPPWCIHVEAEFGRQTRLEIGKNQLTLPKGRHNCTLRRSGHFLSVSVDGRLAYGGLHSESDRICFSGKELPALSSFYASEEPDAMPVFFDASDRLSVLYQHYVRPVGGVFRATPGWAFSGGVLSSPGPPSELRFAEVLPPEFSITADAVLSGDARLEVDAGGTKIAAAGDTVQRLAAERSPLLWGAADRTPLPDGIEISRIGQLAGRLFTEPVWAVEPPESERTLLIKAAGRVQLRNLLIASPSLRTFAFNKLEPGWFIESGRWRIHDGLACIAWDHWIGAEAQPEAFLWLQEQIGGDFLLGLQVSEASKGYSDGTHRHFPYHDVYVNVCAEKMDPTSGYAFVIGADGGRLTRLYRRGRLVGESAALRIQMGSHCNHPREILVRVVRKSSTLKLILNGSTLLEYEDRAPLRGGLIGIGAKECRVNFKDFFVYPL